MSNEILQKQILLEAKINNEKKSVLVAYLLLFLLGGLGMHRFYLGNWIIGLIILISTILSFTNLGFLIVTGLICLLDIFLIPLIMRERNLKLRDKFQKEINSYSNN